jgi:enamine deaminase RidA (YjgF/YER057c/UK114 family)
MVAILENEKMSLNNLIRQWNYIGNILDVKDGYQNYQIFNEVRNDYYSRFRTVKGYPAATGVGMKHGGVILDFCAVDLNDSLKIKAVENPNQVNAYNYGQQVLMGLRDKDKSTKHAPQFERALLVANNHDAYLHISGTASIIGQETIGKDDIGKQTVVTLENIKKLTETERLRSIISDPAISHEKYSLFRIYIKNQSDFNIVRRICNEQFPKIPAIYIEADICRDDLLMEIEAEVELV